MHITGVKEASLADKFLQFVNENNSQFTAIAEEIVGEIAERMRGGGGGGGGSNNGGWKYNIWKYRF